MSLTAFMLSITNTYKLPGLICRLGYPVQRYPVQENMHLFSFLVIANSVVKITPVIFYIFDE
jgi:hypothetical protein